jgi:hypothetical protein
MFWVMMAIATPFAIFALLVLATASLNALRKWLARKMR